MGGFQFFCVERLERVRCEASTEYVQPSIFNRISGFRNINDSEPSNNLSQQQVNYSQKLQLDPQEAMEKKEIETISGKENPLSQNAIMYDNAIPNTPEVPVGTKRTSNFKSKLCPIFEAGSCSSGSNCQFAHGDSDLRCDVFYHLNACAYGDKCKFRHITGPRESCAITIETISKPIAWKTKLCPHWEKYGRCRHGNTCFFAHGSSELRLRSAGEMPLPSNSSGTLMGNYRLGNNKNQGVPSVETSPNIVKLPRKLAGIYGDWIGEP